MQRLFGLETEYGIYVEGADPSQLVTAARDVVGAYAQPCFRGWDYRGESPRQDMRGFRVAHLARNPEDEKYERAAAQPGNAEDTRNDRVLTNGARFYNDHGHPEYSTPECGSLFELVAHDRAGERIVQDCACRYAAATGRTVRIYKNNTDYHGMSYGCHENYLIGRELPFEDLAAGLVPFLVTRQIFTGAGKVGVEADRPARPVDFQLSQRADFFTVETSVDTLHRRPILNTRDEPHADPRLYRRCHVIAGDANMSGFATALKVGTTALVLRLLQTGWRPEIRIRNPVQAVKAISRDASLKWLVDCVEGTRSAIDVQWRYLESAECIAEDHDERWVVHEWRNVLAALARDPMSLTNRLDWVAKRHLLELYREEENLSWDDEFLCALDLEYHNIDRAAGLFHGLVETGEMDVLVTEDAVAAAMQQPPRTLRARARGKLVASFASQLANVTWNRVTWHEGDETFVIDMSPWLDGEAADLVAALERACSLEEVKTLLNGGLSCTD